MKPQGSMIALSLIVVVLTAGTARADEMITIPCTRLDEFLRGGLEVPAGASVTVTAHTLRSLIVAVGGADNFAVLMQTPEGRAAVRAMHPISDGEFVWCKQRVQDELWRREFMRRQRERPASGGRPRGRGEPGALVALSPGAGWYLMVPPEDDIFVRVLAITYSLEPERMTAAVHAEPIVALPVTGAWTRLAAFDTAASCEEARDLGDFQARALALRTIERFRVLLAAGEPLAGQAEPLTSAIAIFVLSRASQCLIALDPRLIPTTRREGAALPALAVIPFQPGKPVYVDVRINESTAARLVVDTGADGTVIVPRVLRAAGALRRGPTGTLTLFGVTGTTPVEVYEVKSVEVGRARVGPLAVAAHDMHDPASDGLLGRDFLDQFKVTIDSAAGKVTLETK